MARYRVSWCPADGRQLRQLGPFTVARGRRGVLCAAGGARAVLVIELLAKRLPGSHVRTRDPPFRAATTVPTGRAATPGHSSGPSLRHAIAPFGNVLSLAPDEMNEMTLTLHTRATLSVLLLSAAGSLVAACGASTTNAACRVTSATAADVAVNAASGCWDCSRGAAEGRSSAWWRNRTVQWRSRLRSMWTRRHW